MADDCTSQGVNDDEIRDLMSGYYREEMRRVLTWRNRLDRTTNWGVVLTAALLTWSFSSREHPHYVLLIAVVALLIFLVIEARRYRFFDLFRARIRLIEENVFACALDPKTALRHEDWRKLLAKDLREPVFKLGWNEAIQRRLRRVYGALFAVLLLAWFARVWARPKAERTLVDAAAIDGLPGEAVLIMVGTLTILLILWAVWPIKRKAMGEIQENGVDPDGWKQGAGD